MNTHIQYQRGVTEEKTGHAPFLHKLNFYHMTRLLENFGVKKTNLVAWVGAYSLFFGLFWHR